MSYLTQNKIATSGSMTNRVAQCATQENIPDADAWTIRTRREWGASPGWDDAWAYAEANHPDDETYDPGSDETVITDSMILSQVQAMNERDRVQVEPHA